MSEIIKCAIFCSAGASTSLWAAKAQKVANEQGKQIEIKAHTIAIVADEGAKADIILIGPQARYMEKKVKAQFPEKPVSVVPMQIFGLMNGEDSLDYIETVIEELN